MHAVRAILVRRRAYFVRFPKLPCIRAQLQALQEPREIFILIFPTEIQLNPLDHKQTAGDSFDVSFGADRYGRRRPDQSEMRRVLE